MACYTKTDSNGNPNVFKLERNEDGLWLNANYANPENQWNSEVQFVVSPRKRFFPPSQTWRFFICSTSKLFLQPPSILPISFNLLEISSKCLLEIIFPSHAIQIRNLSVSKIKIHSETLSTFFSFSI